MVTNTLDKRLHEHQYVKITVVIKTHCKFDAPTVRCCETFVVLLTASRGRGGRAENPWTAASTPMEEQARILLYDSMPNQPGIGRQLYPHSG